MGGTQAKGEMGGVYLGFFLLCEGYHIITVHYHKHQMYQFHGIFPTRAKRKERKKVGKIRGINLELYCGETLDVAVSFREVDTWVRERGKQ